MDSKENIRNIILKYFKEKFPYLDLRIGTGIRDLLIEPLTDYINSLYEEFGDLSKNDIFTTDEILSNLGIERKSGYLASGLAKVILKNKTSVFIPADTKLVSPSGFIYYPLSDISVNISDINTNIITGEYSTTIPIVAADYGDSYNLKQGISLEIEAVNPNIISVETYTDIIGGTASESDEEFYNRAKDVLSLRNYVSPKSIKSALLNNFDFVYKAEAIGYGDAEMVRDIVTLSNGNTYHIGGRSDIYVKTSDTFFKKEYTIDEFGQLNENLVKGIVFVTDPSGNIIYDITTNTDVNNRIRPFSAKSEVYLPASYSESTVIVYYIPYIDYLQRFFETTDSKVLTYDSLVRSYFPAIVDMEITIDGKDLPPEDDFITLLKYYIRTTDLFKISDVVNILYSLGANYVQQPVSAKISLLKDVNKVESIVIYDLFNYSDELYPEITNRTITFFPGDIKINVLSTNEIYTISSGIDVGYAFVYSTAGAKESYMYWGKKAHPEIQDIGVTSSAPGVVDIYVLQKGKTTTDQYILDAVERALNDDKVRPLTDEVIVHPANVLTVKLEVTAYVKRDYEDKMDLVESRIISKINEYAEWQRTVIGRPLNPAELTAKLMLLPELHYIEAVYKDDTDTVIADVLNYIGPGDIANITQDNTTINYVMYDGIH